MKISVAGTDYVDLYLAILLAQNNDVVALDIVPEKIDLLNKTKSPIIDVIIFYEPVLSEPEFFQSKVIADLTIFKTMSDVSVSNRSMEDIKDVADKVVCQ